MLRSKLSSSSDIIYTKNEINHLYGILIKDFLSETVEFKKISEAMLSLRELFRENEARLVDIGIDEEILPIQQWRLLAQYLKFAYAKHDNNFIFHKNPLGKLASINILGAPSVKEDANARTN